MCFPAAVKFQVLAGGKLPCTKPQKPITLGSLKVTQSLHLLLNSLQETHQMCTMWSNGIWKLNCSLLQQVRNNWGE